MAAVMTSPASAPLPAKKVRVPKTVWDLVFTLIIPILILSPNILGSGVSVANLMGGGKTGDRKSVV